jgi:hypothetical protein
LCYILGMRNIGIPQINRVLKKRRYFDNKNEANQFLLKNSKVFQRYHLNCQNDYIQYGFQKTSVSDNNNNSNNSNGKIELVFPPILESKIFDTTPHEINFLGN